MPIIAKNLDWPGADEIAEVLKAPPAPTKEQMQQQLQAAVQQALGSQSEQNKSKEIQIKEFESMTKRMTMISDAMTDDDELKLELLKILDANGVQDEEIRGRAVEIIQQMNDEKVAGKENYEQLWNS